MPNNYHSGGGDRWSGAFPAYDGVCRREEESPRGWPLFTADALKWPAGSIKVVAVDALPAQLGYVKDGYVEALLAQDCYGWGTKSVEILLDKILKNQSPADVKVIDPLTLVTKENVDS